MSHTGLQGLPVKETQTPAQAGGCVPGVYSQMKLELGRIVFNEQADDTDIYIELCERIGYLYDWLVTVLFACGQVLTQGGYTKFLCHQFGLTVGAEFGDLVAIRILAIIDSLCWIVGPIGFRSNVIFESCPVEWIMSNRLILGRWFDKHGFSGGPSKAFLEKNTTDWVIGRRGERVFERALIDAYGDAAELVLLGRLGGSGPIPGDRFTGSVLSLTPDHIYYEDSDSRTTRGFGLDVLAAAAATVEKERGQDAECEELDGDSVPVPRRGANGIDDRGAIPRTSKITRSTHYETGDWDGDVSNDGEASLADGFGLPANNQEEWAEKLAGRRAAARERRRRESLGNLAGYLGTERHVLFETAASILERERQRELERKVEEGGGCDALSTYGRYAGIVGGSRLALDDDERYEIGAFPSFSRCYNSEKEGVCASCRVVLRKHGYSEIDLCEEVRGIDWSPDVGITAVELEQARQDLVSQLRRAGSGDPGRCSSGKLASSNVSQIGGPLGCKRGDQRRVCALCAQDFVCDCAGSPAGILLCEGEIDGSSASSEEIDGDSELLDVDGEGDGSQVT